MITSGLSCDTLAYMRIADFIPGYSKEFEDYVRFRVEIERMSIEEAERDYKLPNSILRSVDSNLRVRWDYLKHDKLIIERYILSEDGYMEVCVWPEPDSSPTSCRKVEALLRERDMQRFDSPEAYKHHKSAQAEKVRDSNDKKATDNILATVDRLTAKRIKNFVAVERALQTGDTIRLHGDDAKSFEIMEKASKESEARGEVVPTRDSAINPGGHPLVRRRP